MTTTVKSTAYGARVTAHEALPQRIWICSHARTASNVLAKQLSDHPQIAFKQDSMMDAYLFGPEKLVAGNFPPLKAEAKDMTFQDGFDGLQQFMETAESDGKILVMKEHIYFILDPRIAASKFPPADGQPSKPCPKVIYQPSTGVGHNDSIPVSDSSSFPWWTSLTDLIQAILGRTMTRELRPLGQVKTNPSLLPDDFIRTLSPVIQIRHPAISVPSYYRAALSVTGDSSLYTTDFVYSRSYAFSRMVFDWYCENKYPERKKTQRGHHSWPLVVDGVDLVDDNERVVSGFCELAGVHKKGVRQEWEPVPEEVKQKQPKNVQRFLSTLQSSNGVAQSGYQGGDVSIEKEMEKWTNEFGPKVANRLKEVAEATMEDYWYLWQYRI